MLIVVLFHVLSPISFNNSVRSVIDTSIVHKSQCFIFLQHPDQSHTVHVSYLEIYNESGYDLLDPKHEASKLEDLP